MRPGATETRTMTTRERYLQQTYSLTHRILHTIEVGDWYMYDRLVAVLKRVRQEAS
jgi:hypothetical protein